MSTTRKLKGAHQFTGTIQADGTITLNAGAWNTAHLVWGTYHVWMGTSVLRIKNGAPTSADDGNPVSNLTSGTITHTGDMEIQNQVDATVPLRVKGTASQSGNLLQLSNSAGSTHYLATGTAGTTLKGVLTVENQVDASVPIIAKGTASQSGALLKLQNSAGSTDYLSIAADGTATINGGAYNTGHLVLGTYHFWVNPGDADLMMKNGVPASATDGTQVGFSYTGYSHRMILDGWYMDNVPASMSDTAMNYLSGAGSKTIRMHRAGSVVGACLYVANSDKVTQGEAYIIVYKNGATLSMTGLPKLDTSGAPNDEYRYKTFTKGAWTFAAGDTLAIYLNANSALLPNGTSDMRAYIEIET
jgi:hypothetical protein